ncbi:adipokinetic hormone/corazonin-related peptide receptor variant I-like isoform X2 [Saccostrea echinata]|uniref:adipokinetic hormone/corazonin-related peptide receptor variant I-like isoform X2 n=1 Tax=Saccostrea echinata TaxID=191078 RepID=UPI002A821307|nr:adipokinetic hormone/corazonin-related peptide receptor variant I-like isoform X2 [Saccostrea echinata]
MDGNFSNVSDVPDHLKFNDNNAYTIISLGSMFLVGALGNIAFFVTLFSSEKRKSPTNFFLLHLSSANLMVMFVIPVGEMILNATVVWKGGTFLCKLYKFLWSFGQYTTIFLLCCISIDRFLAFVFPLRSITQSPRTRSLMAASAWLVSAFLAIPESVIFHVETHPKHKTFTQCVTFNFFPSDNHELAYNLFNLITLYALPLLIITTSYSLILWEISKKTKQCKEETKCLSTRSRLRRSSVGNMERARIRTLKMTLVIVSVFVICWTPYFVLSTWWWFDRESASQLDPKVQRGLFLFAVSNSCMDPIVYGMFTINFKREFVRCCCCLKSTWKRHKLQRLTGKFQTSTGVQRGPISHTLSNNSNRSLQGTNVVKFFDDPAGCRNNGSSNVSRDLKLTNSVSNRANVNNFMTVNLPIMQQIVTNDEQ